MASITRRFSSALLAAAMVAGLAAEPAFAQVTPGGALNGPAGGTATTTAPSNSEGTPAGGTGAIGTTRVSPGRTSATATPHRRRVRHARQRAHRPARPAATSDTGSSAGLNGSNAPAR
jgi:hypothetical protein